MSDIIDRLRLLKKILLVQYDLNGKKNALSRNLPLPKHPLTIAELQKRKSKLAFALEDLESQKASLKEDIDDNRNHRLSKAFRLYFSDFFHDYFLFPFIVSTVLNVGILFGFWFRYWWVCIIVYSLAFVLSLLVWLIKSLGEVDSSNREKRNKVFALNLEIDEKSEELRSIEEKIAGGKTIPPDYSESELAVLSAFNKCKSDLRVIDKTLSAISKEGNFLYPKYLNLPAVCTFIDYLSSGRCERLEGPDGCYNLYEFEARMDLVITNLENINSNLQYISSEVQSLSHELRDINNKLSRFASDLNRIALHTGELSSKASIAIGDTKYIKACQTFLIADSLPYISKEVTLMKALGDIRY